MDNEKTISEIAKELIKEGVATVNIEVRTGEALTLHHAEDVAITGAICSPSRWIESRQGLFDVKKSFCYIDRDKKLIKLTINEQSAHGKYVIVGSLQVSKEFEELGINTSKKYTPIQLANVLKLKRSIFPNKADHAIIITTLRNIKAKINKALEDLNDQKGNVTKHFEQTVESNMPDSFEVCLPLLKGEEKSKFDLNVVLEAEGTDIYCYLESIDAQELIDAISEKRIDEEIEKIKDFTTIIEC